MLSEMCAVEEMVEDGLSANQKALKILMILLCQDNQRLLWVVLPVETAMVPLFSLVKEVYISQ